MLWVGITLHYRAVGKSGPQQTTASEQESSFLGYAVLREPPMRITYDQEVDAPYIRFHRDHGHDEALGGRYCCRLRRRRPLGWNRNPGRQEAVGRSGCISESDAGGCLPGPLAAHAIGWHRRELPPPRSTAPCRGTFCSVRRAALWSSSFPARSDAGRGPRPARWRRHRNPDARLPAVR